VPIAVIDGQGGGIGSLIVRRLREEFGERIEILALGTNAAATTAMMKAKADRGATGENAIVRNVSQVAAVCGSVGVVLPHAYLGEMTPAMAEAVSASPARKILLPLNRERVTIVGASGDPLPHLVEDLVEHVKEMIHV